MTSIEPLFNLKAVVRQTGIKPDTLRAWERRYGLPSPRRSAGGHRLYSQREIDTIKWLTDRQQEGLSIKRAVEQWHQIEADGRDPLQEASATGYPDPDSSCQSQFIAYRVLSFVSSLIKRNHRNYFAVSTSPAHTRLYQSCTKHSILTGRLPYIPNAGTMYEALGQALPGQLSSASW